jgi:hypothetical protein
MARLAGAQLVLSTRIEEHSAMSTDDETIRRRYREFLELMPLTISIAGLPVSESPYNFTPEQMEIRVHTLSTAFKLARQMVRDAVTGG